MQEEIAWLTDLQKNDLNRRRTQSIVGSTLSTQSIVGSTLRRGDWPGGWGRQCRQTEHGCST